MLANLKILVFSWNTQSIRLGESLRTEVLDENRTGALGIPGATTYWYEAKSPDFFSYLIPYFKDVDIVVFGLQEDASPGSYFHSHFLQDVMPEYGFELVRRSKLLGVGKTTVDRLPTDVMFRGLRTSVYCKERIRREIVSVSEGSYLCTWKDTITGGKGGLAIYLQTRNHGKIGIVNVHLPHDAKSLTESVRQQDPILRKNAVMRQYQYFNEVYSALIKNHCDSSILFGDMNFRVVSTMTDDRTGRLLTYEKLCSTAISNPELLLVDDELYFALVNKLVYHMDEGVDKAGPTFAPTCKLKRNRPQQLVPDMYNLGKYGQRCPSWCDRILYSSKKGELECEYYDRFDFGSTMKLSDHAGVISKFVLKASDDSGSSSD